MKLTLENAYNKIVEDWFKACCTIEPNLAGQTGSDLFDDFMTSYFHSKRLVPNLSGFEEVLVEHLALEARPLTDIERMQEPKDDPAKLFFINVQLV